MDGDLRIWSRDKGTFIKKFDLNSFIGDSVSSMKVGTIPGTLFLGCKDMNVYQIDLQRGKLCLVYEGHWSKVTSIFIPQDKAILFTLADSNIKIWDLEFDECIWNMNDHDSLIVYCGVSKRDDSLLVTISETLEYKEWNYVTGQITNEFTISLSQYVQASDSDMTDDLSAREAPLLGTEKKNDLLKACFIGENDIIYLALDSKKIAVYNTRLHTVLC